MTDVELLPQNRLISISIIKKAGLPKIQMYAYL